LVHKIIVTNVFKNIKWKNVVGVVAWFVMNTDFMGEISSKKIEKSQITIFIKSKNKTYWIRQVYGQDTKPLWCRQIPTYSLTQKLAINFLSLAVKFDLQ